MKIIIVSIDKMRLLLLFGVLLLPEITSVLLKYLNKKIMEKFNKKTLIIGLLIFVGLLLLVATTFGQTDFGSKDLNPPQDLTAVVVTENDVNLFWMAPATGDSAYLHWDSGENYTGFGNWIQPTVFDFVAKWDPIHITDYDGWTITKMRFFVASSIPTIKLKIWTGSDFTEIYSQDVPVFNVNSWTEITLDTPITIDASTQLWAGLNIDMPDGGEVMGCDAGPAISGYGNLYRENNVWFDGPLNWNIQILIESSGKKEINDLLGYNVYRNDEQINDNVSSSTSFVDQNLINGTYSYYVTAVYNEGESAASNTAVVIIDQPVILDSDSLALVDLYNNCNGSNWVYNDFWLEGPVSEWFGVTTTGARVTDMHLQSMGVTGDLPASIGDLTALETLWLESNSITSIPESIGNLSALEEFWLGWNSLTSVPESIGNLLNLRELHLGLMDTPLGSLPESFGNLINLEWLALGSSGLNSLPESFGNLSSVESCFLWGNNLTELPLGFGGMESLNYLSLDNNQLTTLPESFGDLDNLSRLFMENNQLVSLPESFGDLQTLDSLWARGNQIAELPESFGNLDDLNFLRLEGNNLSELPVSFTNLATIEKLFLYDNQLDFLAEDFGNLNTLRILDIGANNLTELPESIGELLLLDLFSANGNSLTGIPESFGNLEPDSVFIHNNQIAQLPISLFDNTFDIFTIHENSLQFGSIEPFMDNNITAFWYAPQAKFGNDTIFEVVEGESISYTLEVSGVNNNYQWYKDNVVLAGQTSNTLNIESISILDQGIYQLRVTNSIVPDLELVSYDIVFSIITGIDDVKEQGFSVYPNPVTGNKLNIKLYNIDKAESCLIINSAGQVVKTKELSNDNFEVDITDLISGVYMVKIQFSNHLYQIKKLIVK